VAMVAAQPDRDDGLTAPLPGVVGNLTVTAPVPIRRR
jgi:hypothetical protein